MTNPIPNIHVTNEIIRIRKENPLIRDIVCLIGCFEDTETLNTPVLCKRLTEAEAIFGSDTQYDGNAALKQIFHKDISGCIIVNCTTTTGSGDNITANRSLTVNKIETALNLVRLIDFDQVYCAVEYTDAIVESVDAFCNSRMESKHPCGYTAVGARTSAATYTTTAGKIGDQITAFLTQPLEVNGTMLSLVESGAYLTNLIATLSVGSSLTSKTLTEVTGVGVDYTFDEGDLGETLVGLGFFVVRLIDALNNTYECVNSATPNGLDLYMNRVRDYIVNDFALREALGEMNTVSVDLITLFCGDLYTKFVRDLKLVKDIIYAIEKEDSKTIDVLLEDLVFADITTQINVKINIRRE
ncbi:hypothetical protein [Methanobrevibacter sp.]|uniref:hypothetical protein n=1 Tax=Methanobrevibacter sp. TaxID=66852 RepID=UPI00388E9582